MRRLFLTYCIFLLAGLFTVNSFAQSSYVVAQKKGKRDKEVLRESRVITVFTESENYNGELIILNDSVIQIDKHEISIADIVNIKAKKKGHFVSGIILGGLGAIGLPLGIVTLVDSGNQDLVMELIYGITGLIFTVGGTGGLIAGPILLTHHIWLPSNEWGYKIFVR
jgi:hypothetical protein